MAQTPPRKTSSHSNSTTHSPSLRGPLSTSFNHLSLNNPSSPTSRKTSQLRDTIHKSAKNVSRTIHSNSANGENVSTTATTKKRSYSPVKRAVGGGGDEALAMALGLNSNGGDGNASSRDKSPVKGAGGKMGMV